MAQGDAELQAMIERIRLVGTLAHDAAEVVAPVVRKQIEATIRQGTDPDGNAWKATLEGKVPLRKAAHALGVTAFKGIVYVRLRGPEAMHHRGTARGGIVRQVIPTERKLPDRMNAAIKVALSKRFSELVEGHG